MANVQMGVLKKRRGRLLNRRTILKSYLFDEDTDMSSPAVRMICAAILCMVEAGALTCALLWSAAQASPQPPPMWLAGSALWLTPAPKLANCTSFCTQMPGAPDLRQAEVEHHSILSCGGVTLQGLRDLLTHLDAGPQGSKRVVVTDLREVSCARSQAGPCTPCSAGAAGARCAGLLGRSAPQGSEGLRLRSAWGPKVLRHHPLIIHLLALGPSLEHQRMHRSLPSLTKPMHPALLPPLQELVVYINGVPYTRRELEMPVAALHHAGVHAAQVQDVRAQITGAQGSQPQTARLMCFVCPSVEYSTCALCLGSHEFEECLACTCVRIYTCAYRCACMHTHIHMHARAAGGAGAAAAGGRCG